VVATVSEQKADQSAEVDVNSMVGTSETSNPGTETLGQQPESIGSAQNENTLRASMARAAQEASVASTQTFTHEQIEKVLPNPFENGEAGTPQVVDEAEPAEEVKPAEEASQGSSDVTAAQLQQLVGRYRAPKINRKSGRGGEDPVQAELRALENSPKKVEPVVIKPSVVESVTSAQAEPPKTKPEETVTQVEEPKPAEIISSEPKELTAEDIQGLNANFNAISGDIQNKNVQESLDQTLSVEVAPAEAAPQAVEPVTNHIGDLTEEEAKKYPQLNRIMHGEGEMPELEDDGTPKKPELDADGNPIVKEKKELVLTEEQKRWNEGRALAEHMISVAFKEGKLNDFLELNATKEEMKPMKVEKESEPTEEEKKAKIINAERRGNAALKKVAASVLTELIVHGATVKKDRVTGEEKYLQKADMDGGGFIGMWKLAGINLEEALKIPVPISVRFLEHDAEIPEGAIVGDMGNKDTYIDKKRKTLYQDHHSPESKPDSSATKKAYYALTESGLLERSPQLEVIVKIITGLDNNNFPHANDMENYLKSDKSFLALAKFLNFDQLKYFIEKCGVTVDGPPTPLDIVPDEIINEMHARRLNDWKNNHNPGDHEPEKLWSYIGRERTKIDDSLREVYKLAKEGFVVHEGGRDILVDVGKIIVDDKGNERRVVSVPGGASAAYACKYDTYIMWLPEQNRFVVNSTKELPVDLAEQGVRVRKMMWTKRSDGVELNESLVDVIKKLVSVNGQEGHFNARGEFDKYLQAMEKKRLESVAEGLRVVKAAAEKERAEREANKNDSVGKDDFLDMFMDLPVEGEEPGTVVEPEPTPPPERAPVTTEPANTPEPIGAVFPEAAPVIEPQGDPEIDLELAEENRTEPVDDEREIENRLRSMMDQMLPDQGEVAPRIATPEQNGTRMATAAELQSIGELARDLTPAELQELEDAVSKIELDKLDTLEGETKEKRQEELEEIESINARLRSLLIIEEQKAKVEADLKSRDEMFKQIQKLRNEFVTNEKKPVGLKKFLKSVGDFGKWWEKVTTQGDRLEKKRLAQAAMGFKKTGNRNLF
jgi:hypothetical protein